MPLVKVPVRFEHGALRVAVGLAGEQGWITGIQLLPPSAAEPRQVAGKTGFTLTDE